MPLQGHTPWTFDNEPLHIELLAPQISILNYKRWWVNSFQGWYALNMNDHKSMRSATQHDKYA